MKAKYTEEINMKTKYIYYTILKQVESDKSTKPDKLKGDCIYTVRSRPQERVIE